METMVLAGAVLLLFAGIQAYMAVSKRLRWGKAAQMAFAAVAVLSAIAMIGAMVVEHLYFQKHLGAALFFAGFIVSSAFYSMANGIGAMQARHAVQDPTSPPSAVPGPRPER